MEVDKGDKHLAEVLVEGGLTVLGLFHIYNFYEISYCLYINQKNQ